MKQEKPDQTQTLSRFEGLFVAVIADSLDKVGIRHNVMRSDIRPLYPGARVLGHAFTWLWVDIDHEVKLPYANTLMTLDNAKPGDVIISVTRESAESRMSAIWGELTSTAFGARGGVGAIIDGYSRDTEKVMEMKFPVFTKGICAYDSDGRSDLVACNVPVRCGGVLVNPGDIIFGDTDGVVVVPQDVAQEVLRLAEEKAATEDVTKEALRRGEKISAVYAKYHVL